MASKTWNVGIVGYGFSAKTFHIPFVQDVPQFKLYAVVQRTPKPDDDAEKDHPGIKSYRSAEDLVQDAGVDVVVITTAPDSHHYLAKLALENGKHGESSYSPDVDFLFCQRSVLIGYSHLRETVYPNLQRSRRARRSRQEAEQVPRRIPEYAITASIDPAIDR
jgi:hypothetical protein